MDMNRGGRQIVHSNPSGAFRPIPLLSMGRPSNSLFGRPGTLPIVLWFNLFPLSRTPLFRQIRCWRSGPYLCHCPCVACPNLFGDVPLIVSSVPFPRGVPLPMSLPGDLLPLRPFDALLLPEAAGPAGEPGRRLSRWAACDLRFFSLSA